MIDSQDEGRLCAHDDETDELLFGRFTDKEVESDQQKNWPSTVRHFKTSD